MLKADMKCLWAVVVCWVWVSSSIEVCCAPTTLANDVNATPSPIDVKPADDVVPSDDVKKDPPVPGDNEIGDNADISDVDSPDDVKQDGSAVHADEEKSENNNNNGKEPLIGIVPSVPSATLEDVQDGTMSEDEDGSDHDEEFREHPGQVNTGADDKSEKDEKLSAEAVQPKEPHAGEREEDHEPLEPESVEPSKSGVETTEDEIQNEAKETEILKEEASEENVKEEVEEHSEVKSEAVNVAAADSQAPSADGYEADDQEPAEELPVSKQEEDIAAIQESERDLKPEEVISINPESGLSGDDHEGKHEEDKETDEFSHEDVDDKKSAAEETPDDDLASKGEENTAKEDASADGEQDPHIHAKTEAEMEHDSVPKGAEASMESPAEGTKEELEKTSEETPTQAVKADAHEDHQDIGVDEKDSDEGDTESMDTELDPTHEKQGQDEDESMADNAEPGVEISDVVKGEDGKGRTQFDETVEKPPISEAKVEKEHIPEQAGENYIVDQDDQDTQKDEEALKEAVDVQEEAEDTHASDSKKGFGDEVIKNGQEQDAEAEDNEANDDVEHGTELQAETEPASEAEEQDIEIKAVEDGHPEDDTEHKEESQTETELASQAQELDTKIKAVEDGHPDDDAESQAETEPASQAEEQDIEIKAMEDGHHGENDEQDPSKAQDPTEEHAYREELEVDIEADVDSMTKAEEPAAKHPEEKVEQDQDALEDSESKTESGIVAHVREEESDTEHKDNEEQVSEVEKSEIEHKYPVDSEGDEADKDVRDGSEDDSKDTETDEVSPEDTTIQDGNVKGNDENDVKKPTAEHEHHEGELGEDHIFEKDKESKTEEPEAEHAHHEEEILEDELVEENTDRKMEDPKGEHEYPGERENFEELEEPSEEHLHPEDAGDDEAEELTEEGSEKIDNLVDIPEKNQSHESEDEKETDLEHPVAEDSIDDTVKSPSSSNMTEAKIHYSHTHSDNESDSGPSIESIPMHIDDDEDDMDDDDGDDGEGDKDDLVDENEVKYDSSNTNSTTSVMLIAEKRQEGTRVDADEEPDQSAPPNVHTNVESNATEPSRDEEAENDIHDPSSHTAAPVEEHHIDLNNNSTLREEHPADADSDDEPSEKIKEVSLESDIESDDNDVNNTAVAETDDNLQSAFPSTSNNETKPEDDVEDVATKVPSPDEETETVDSPDPGSVLQTLPSGQNGTGVDDKFDDGEDDGINDHLKHTTTALPRDSPTTVVYEDKVSNDTNEATLLIAPAVAGDEKDVDNDTLITSTYKRVVAELATSSPAKPEGDESKSGAGNASYPVEHHPEQTTSEDEDIVTSTQSSVVGSGPQETTTSPVAVVPDKGLLEKTHTEEEHQNCCGRQSSEQGGCDPTQECPERNKTTLHSVSPSVKQEITTISYVEMNDSKTHIPVAQTGKQEITTNSHIELNGSKIDIPARTGKQEITTDSHIKLNDSITDIPVAQTGKQEITTNSHIELNDSKTGIPVAQTGKQEIATDSHIKLNDSRTDTPVAQTGKQEITTDSHIKLNDSKTDITVVQPEKQETSTIPQNNSSTGIPVVMPPAPSVEDVSANEAGEKQLQTTHLPDQTTNETDDSGVVIPVVPQPGVVNDDESDNVTQPSFTTSHPERGKSTGSVHVAGDNNDEADDDHDDDDDAIARVTQTSFTTLTTSAQPEEEKIEKTDGIIPIIDVTTHKSFQGAEVKSEDGAKDEEEEEATTPKQTQQHQDSTTELVLFTPVSQPQSTSPSSIMLPPSENQPDAGKDSSRPPPVSTASHRIPSLEEVEATEATEKEVEENRVTNLGSGAEGPVVTVDGGQGGGKADGGNASTVEGGDEAGEERQPGEDGVLTRNPPSRPGDGIRRGQGTRVWVEDKMEETEGTEGVLNVKKAKQGGDSEEDMESKKRTAIIVGVAVGGVAMFALAFFVFRNYKKRGDFKVLSQSPEENAKAEGNGDAIEFCPLNSNANIYEEVVDEVGSRGSKGGLQVVRNRGYSPVASDPDPSDHVYAVVNKNKNMPVSTSLHDEHVNGIEQIQFMDDGTGEDVAESTPSDQLLPATDTTSAQLPEVRKNGSTQLPPELEPHPSPSSASDESQTSLSTDVMRDLEKKMTIGGGSNR